MAGKWDWTSTSCCVPTSGRGYPSMSEQAKLEMLLQWPPSFQESCMKGEGIRAINR